jgi:hypothetical protein
MASFDFTRAVLDEGTTFIFGSCVCIANGSGGFHSHLADTREPETSVATQHGDLDEFIPKLDKMLLPGLTREIELESVFDVTSTRTAPRLPRLDLIQSGEKCTRFLFGLCNTASAYQEALRIEPLSSLEKDLDRLLKIGEGEATACWEAPIFDIYSHLDDDSEPFSGSHLGLTIASTPQGRFVSWKGMEPFELLEYDSRLVAFTQELPFQEGRPLPPITEEGEGSTELVVYSSSGEFSLDRHVYMASSLPSTNMATMTSLEGSTTTNYSQKSPLTKQRWTPP